MLALKIPAPKLKRLGTCWLHGGRVQWSVSMVGFSLSLVRSLVYVFYITGGPRDLVPYIPTVPIEGEGPGPGRGKKRNQSC